MAALIALAYVILFGVEAKADGFSRRLVRFDGEVAKGKLDSSGNLIFIGRGRWNAPLKIKFSPFVRVYFELVPFIETESHGILGEFTITFTFVPKARGASHQNLWPPQTAQHGRLVLPLSENLSRYRSPTRQKKAKA
jgi:hypothetical protein